MSRTVIKCCSWYWKTAIMSVTKDCSYRENCPYEYGKASKKDGLTVDIICGLGYNSSKETPL